MGLIGWLFGVKSEPRIPRPTFADLVQLVEGDDGYPATELQLAALQRLGCGDPPDSITLRQASAIISAREYAGYVLGEVLAKRVGREGFYDLQANIIALIMTDASARIAVIRWNQRNFDDGEDRPPRRDEHWRSITMSIAPAVHYLTKRR